MDWLQEIDNTYLHKDSLKDQSRLRLFSSLAFNMGWLPEDPKPGVNVESVNAAAAAQYEKRGRPTSHTGWSVKEQHMYMRWQLSLFKRGLLRRQEVGGFAWKLPEKGKHGKPAPLPDEVVEFSRRGAGSQVHEPRRVDAHRSSGAKDDPHAGFKLVSRIGVSCVVFLGFFHYYPQCRPCQC